MKKLIFLSVFVLTPLLSSAYASVDISIGGTAWYNWWQPAWRDATIINTFIIPGLSGFTYQDHQDFTVRSNIMAGPVLSIQLPERWSITSVFVIGKFKFQSGGLSLNLINLYSIGTQFTVTFRKYSRDVLKWDSDSTIGYSFHKYIKVFIGFKAQGYSYDETMKDWAPTDYTYRMLNYVMNSYGTGAGVGFTIPLVYNLYMLVNASGLFLWSFDKASLGKAYAVTLSSNNVNPMIISYPRGRFFSYGTNTNLSLAYYFDTINTTVSLGGRYQMLFNRQKFKSIFNNNVAQNIIEKQYDHFYGITVSVIYTFEITKK